MNSLGDRMKKNYENRYRIKLSRRIPVIIRLDGRAFHNLTRNCEKPFDNHFSACMELTALDLCAEIQGAKCAYVQSDEISILVTDFDKLTTEAWFDYNIQKMVSVSAGLASSKFSRYFSYVSVGIFDSRVFSIPREEVANYFIWRQSDWIRNSVAMLSQSVYSHKELHKKNQSDMHEMLHAKNINWSDLDGKWKNGVFVYRDGGNLNTVEAPIFTQDRYSIERYLRDDAEKADS